jgi:hypothetical protein
MQNPEIVEIAPELPEELATPQIETVENSKCDCVKERVFPAQGRLPSNNAKPS